MADNAIYTPTPETLAVVVYRDHHDGQVRATTGPVHLVADRGEIIGQETARVVGRGNLCQSGMQRWYQIELADGSRHSVIGEGS